jgi:hypothetical protein
VLYAAEFDGHFRPDLLAAVRGSRAVMKEERPWSTKGIDACAVIGDATCDALKGMITVKAAVEKMQRGLEALP